MSMTSFKIPLDIEPEAKKYMKEVVSMLTENGLIERVDDAAIKMLAYNYSTFIKAQKTISKDGLTVISDRGNIAEHPAVKIGKDAQVQAMKVMQEFGLTARSRKKLLNTQELEDETALDDYFKDKLND